MVWLLRFGKSPRNVKLIKCKWADRESRSHGNSLRIAGNSKACDKQIFWYLPQKYLICLRTSHGMLRTRGSWPQDLPLKVDNQVLCTLK